MRFYQWKKWLALTVGPYAFFAFIVPSTSPFVAPITWVLLAWSGIYLVVVIRNGRRERIRYEWKYKNLCRNCGYSLRGLRGTRTNMSGNCPECGTPFS